MSMASLTSLSLKQWIFVILSGAGGALSWILFYHALQAGPAIPVTVIDKLSIVFTAILAYLFLTEKISLQAGIGLVFISLGSLLVAIPIEKMVAFFK
jgi:transporter family protein